MKRQLTEWEIFANETTNKCLISKINKELIQLNNNKKKKIPIQKWAEDLTGISAKKTYSWPTGT